MEIHSRSTMNKKSDTKPGFSISKIDLLAFACSISVSIICVYIYMSNENALYWCDFNYYHVLATEIKHQLLNQPLQFPITVFFSTYLIYNFIFAIPLFPITLIFGDGRETFIYALAVIYQLPYLLLAGHLASEAIKESDKLPGSVIRWITVFIGLATPCVWAPTLRGYPDFGPALLVMLAAVFYLQDSSLKSKKTILKIGICLALAPIIRRHFFYFSFAQAAAMLIHQIYLSRINKQSLESFFKSSFLNWVAIGLVSTAVLLTIGILFISNIVNNPFFSLYESAYVNPLEGINYLVSAYGLVAFFIAGAGLYLGFTKRIFNQDKAVFICTFATLSFLIWPFLGKHLAIHYTIYSDFFVILGTVSFFSWLAESGSIKIRSYLCALLVFFWSSNFVMGLSPGDKSFCSLTKYGMLTNPQNRADMLGKLFTANFGPIQRNDLKEFARLYSFLAEETKGKKNILIGSENRILAAEMFRVFERNKTGKIKTSELKLIDPPILDSRDPLMIEAVLNSDYVVIVEPFKPMYKEEGSKTLQSLAVCFNQGWPIANDFQKLDESFSLDEGSTATIFKRTNSTSPEIAVATFEKFKNYVNSKLAGQPKWISTDGGFKVQNTQSKTEFEVVSNQQQGKNIHYMVSSFLVDGTFSLKGTVKQSFKGMFSQRLLAISANGEMVTINTTDKTKEKINFSGKLEKPSYLVLSFFSEEEEILTVKDPVVEQ